MEHSLLLFKPDSFSYPEIFQETKLILKECNLEIVNKKEFVINKGQILGIWSKRCFDPFTYNVMVKAYEGKNFLLWEVKGNNAITVCLNIKKKIRTKYSLSFIKNSVHSPNNINEYKANMVAIYKTMTPIHPPLYYELTEVMNKSKRVIEKDSFSKCIDFFVTAEDKIYKDLYKCSKKYEIILDRDNIHWLTEYAVLLYNNMPELPLCTAYIYAMAVVEYEKVPIYRTDDIHSVDKMFSLLQASKLMMRIHEYD